MLYSHKISTVQVNVEDLHYRVLGAENQETLVLIHGLDSAGGTFYNVVEELAQKYRVITYDQRGHGKSADIGVEYSSQTMAGDLRLLLDHLGVERAHVLGHSMGARTATRFVHSYPERASSLIIEDMELFSRVPEETFTEEALEKVFALARTLRDKFEGAVFQNRAELTDALLPHYGEEAHSLTYRRAEEHADGTFTLMFRPWVSVLYGFQGNLEDFSPELSQVTLPVLIMQANPRRGTALSGPGVAHLKEMLTHSRDVNHVYFKKAGHTIHRSDESKFLQELESFVDSH